MPVHGRKTIEKRSRTIQRNVKAEVSRQLDENADDLLSRAQGLAPQLEGDLIASGIIKKRRFRAAVSRTVKFTSPYAVVRHEDFYNLGPVSEVKKSPDGRIGRKYLSRPFRKNRARYQKEIGNAIDRAIRGSLR